MNSRIDAERLFIAFFLLVVSTFMSLHANEGLFLYKAFRFFSIGLNLFCFSFLIFNFSDKVKNIGILLIVLDVLFHFFPVPHGIPFFVFSLDRNLYFLNLFLSLLIYLITSYKINDKLLADLIKWSPLSFLVIINFVYSFFGFNYIDPHDGARHISNAFAIYDNLVSGKSDKLLTSITFYDFYFPVSYLITFPFLLVFGKSFTAGCLTLSLFWLPLGYNYLWKILVRFFGAVPMVSSLVCFLLFGTTMSQSLLKNYMQDFPAMVVFVCFLYFYLKSGFFSERKNTLVAGIIFGLGILTKANFFLLGIIPVVYSIYVSFRSNETISRVINILFFFFVVCFIASIWFSVNIFHFSYEINNGVKQYGENNFPPVFSWLSFRWYFIAFIYSFGVFQTILFLLSLFFILRHRREISSNVVFAIVSFVFFFFIIILFKVKDQRTLFPSLVLIAPIFLQFFSKLKGNIKIIAFSALLLFVVQENVFLLSGSSKILPKIILSEPFVVNAGFLTPESDDPNKSHFIFNKLLKNNSLSQYENSISWRGDFTPFYQRFCNRIESEDFSGIKNGRMPNEKIIFCKDKFWTDYYLFGCNLDSFVTIRTIGYSAQIKGDFSLRIKIFDSNNGLVKDSAINFVPEIDLISIKNPIQNSRLELSFFVHHSHPSGQRVKAYYQFLGKTSYDQFNVPLEPFQPDGSRKEFTEIRL